MRARRQSEPFQSLLAEAGRPFLARLFAFKRRTSEITDQILTVQSAEQIPLPEKRGSMPPASEPQINSPAGRQNNSAARKSRIKPRRPEPHINSRRQKPQINSVRARRQFNSLA